MIPPSILLIIYGIFVEQPISQLFAGAFLPGVLTALMYSLMVFVDPFPYVSDTRVSSSRRTSCTMATS